MAASVAQYMASLKKSSLTDSPYGVPYKPDVWGAGWIIMRRERIPWILCFRYWQFRNCTQVNEKQRMELNNNSTKFNVTPVY